MKKELIADIFLIRMYGNERFQQYLDVYIKDPQTYFYGIKALSDMVMSEFETNNTIEQVVRE